MRANEFLIENVLNEGIELPYKGYVIKAFTPKNSSMAKAWVGDRSGNQFTNITKLFPMIEAGTEEEALEIQKQKIDDYTSRGMNASTFKMYPNKALQAVLGLRDGIYMAADTGNVVYISTVNHPGLRKSIRYADGTGFGTPVSKDELVRAGLTAGKRYEVIEKQQIDPNTVALTLKEYNTITHSGDKDDNSVPLVNIQLAGRNKGVTKESVNPAQQAAIAIAMKKAGKKPHNEGYAMEDKQVNGMAQGEIREIIRNAVKIKEKLDGGTSLDGWMYSYVTTSNDRLNSVAEQIGNPNISDEEDLEEGSITPNVTVNKVHDDGHEKEWHVFRGKEMIGYVIKNQPDTSEGLYIAYGHGPGRAFVEEFRGLKSAVNYITSLKESVEEGNDKNVVVKFSASEYAAMSPEQKAAKQQEWQTLKQQAKRQLKNFTLVDTDKEQGVAEGENWSKYNHKRVGGMSKKSVSSYRRSHPGSKIQTAVTTKPSKLKKGSKAAKRRASFCARMRGMKKHRTSAKTAHDPNSNINKSLRRWHCESIEQMQELVMLAEQFIAKNKKI